MKVLYLIDSLEGYGAEKSLVEIARQFQSVTPVFVHIYQGDMLKAKLELAGIKVYSLDIDKKYAFDLAAEKLRTIYKKEAPDIVHATLFRSEIIARKLKKEFPQILLVGSFVSNAYSPERYRGKNYLQQLKLRYFQRIDIETAKYVDFFVSNSQTIKEATGRVLKISSEKIEVIYRGRDSSKFTSVNYLDTTPRLDNQDKIILLNVSRLIPLKGQMDLVNAMARVVLEFPKVKLYFAGHGPFRSQLENRVRKLNLINNVEFLGRVENINNLLHNSQVFIYPSYSEGIPGALIEAMMAKKIIICSNIPENLECVDETSALIFEKGNITQLADNIIKILKDPREFNHLGDSARKQAQEKFELSHIVASYENFYKKILTSQGNKPLKILHLIHQPQQRGAEMFTCQLANHQKDLGLEVLIVSIFSGKADLPWKQKIISLQGNRSSRFVDIPAWRKLSGLINDFQPDVIQANAGDTLKYAVFSKKIFRWKSPIIFRNASEVGRYLNSSFQKKYNEFLYKNVDRVISVSEASERDLIKHFTFLKNKTEVVPVGLEEKKKIKSISFKPVDHQHIVHVGGFSFEKNHIGIIEIFEAVLAQNAKVHLHLIGDGALRSEVEQLVKKNSLENNVHFYGFVNNPLSYIKGGNLFILPSIIEGLPGVILEAMYCKTPVIAYDVGGISEIVNKETGELIKKGDVKSFARSIIQRLDEPKTAPVEKAYTMVVNRFMNIKIARKFNSVYKTSKIYNETNYLRNL